MRKAFALPISIILFAAVVLGGCGKADNQEAGAKEPGDGNKAPAISSAPVKIRVSLDGTNLDDDFMEQLAGVLQKTHPNITLDYIKPGKGTTLRELIVAGDTPDIVITYNGNMASYNELDLLYDIMPLTKQYGFNLGRFEPYIIEDAKIASTKDELFGIPINLNYHALYYNKDIFDKFGAPYPTDGMAWEQVIDLAKKVTRTDGGAQYRGLDPGSIVWASQPLGIAAIDYKTDKATVNTDSWKKVFELMKSIYAIPGNENKSDPKKGFLTDKTVAMYANLSIINELEKASQDGLNWDVVQYPSYPEKPNTYGNASVNVMMITKPSKYKEQALQVIEAAVSDELQLASAKQGRVTPMKDPQFKAAFGAGREVMKGKNVQGIFKSRPVKYPIASKYRSKAEAILSAKFVQFNAGQLDVNTALLQAEEEINKMVETERGK
ncbi:ABC transporter substrate-binding protein [Paenibacillus hodogayensis]|uniref:ABC transporter substrate-binding protein n=1 Tax=Paenibacillus hodogayensis TaxID=279208 RepID=A0ABV5W8B0_9BACL